MEKQLSVKKLMDRIREVVNLLNVQGFTEISMHQSDRDVASAFIRFASTSGANVPVKVVGVWESIPVEWTEHGSIPFPSAEGGYTACKKFGNCRLNTGKCKLCMTQNVDEHLRCAGATASGPLVTHSKVARERRKAALKMDKTLLKPVGKVRTEVADVVGVPSDACIPTPKQKRGYAHIEQPAKLVYMSRYGHTPESQGAVIDDFFYYGEWEENIVAHILQYFPNKDKKITTVQVRKHATALGKQRGLSVTIRITDSGKFYKLDVEQWDGNALTPPTIPTIIDERTHKKVKGPRVTSAKVADLFTLQTQD